MEALEKWISVIDFARHTRMGQLGCYSAKRFVEILQSHLSRPAESRLDSDCPALYLWTGFDPLDAADLAPGPRSNSEVLGALRVVRAGGVGPETEAQDRPNGVRRELQCQG